MTSALAFDVRSALREGISRLRAARIPSYTLAAELLLMHALRHDRTWLYTHSETLLDSAEVDGFFALVKRRAAGEPTQYLTGRQEFWGLEFEVNPAVLIPRPETEHLVEVALERLGPRGIKINMVTGKASPTLRVADVGTGSGCLAIALAYELPHAEIVATDISAPALEVARRNAARHSVSDRIHFLQTNILEGASSSSSFDLIASNPPYIAGGEEESLQREVRNHEPHVALFSGALGTEIYSRLIEQASARLTPSGILVLELGFGCADVVRRMFHVQPEWADITLTNDLAGIPRVLSAVRV